MPPGRLQAEFRRSSSETLEFADRRSTNDAPVAAAVKLGSSPQGRLSQMKRHPNVVNVDELEAMSRGKGRFGANARRLANAAGAKAIGMNWMELAPGKTSFPYH